MKRDTVKETIHDAAKTTREAGAAALDSMKTEAKGVASTVADTLRAAAEEHAEHGKEQLSERGQKLTDKLRVRAESADYEVERRVLNAVAGSVSEISKHFSTQSLSSIIEETERFARRNPGAFVAGAAIAGFAMARFSRASGRANDNLPTVQASSDRTTTAGASDGSPHIGSESAAEPRGNDGHEGRL